MQQHRTLHRRRQRRLYGNDLYERKNAKNEPNLDKIYEGTRPATLKRYGETDHRRDEPI